MLRLQTALPERYTTAHPDELARWIADAKAHARARACSSSGTTTSATR